MTDRWQDHFRNDFNAIRNRRESVNLRDSSQERRDHDFCRLKMAWSRIGQNFIASGKTP
jgi:hypothetical protein